MGNRKNQVATVDEIVKQLTLARRYQQLSQEVLGARCGMSGQAISSMENGYRNPTVKTLARVAKALGYDVVVTLVPHIDHEETGGKKAQPVALGVLVTAPS